MKKLFVLLLIVIFVSFNAQAVEYYDDGQEHDISTPVNDGIEIYNGDVHMGPPTTVNLQSGGSIYGADIYDTSLLNVHAGSEVGMIHSHIESNFNIVDGIVHDIELYDQSHGTMSGGTVTQVNVTQDSHFSVSGGEIGNDPYMPAITTFDNGTASISGGFVSEVLSLGNSTVEMSDGEVPRMDLHEYSTANITGGHFDELSLYENSQLVMTDFFMGTGSGVIVNDYSYVSMSGGQGFMSPRGNSTVEIAGAIVDLDIQEDAQVTVSSSEIGMLSDLYMNSSLSLVNTMVGWRDDMSLHDNSHLTASMGTHFGTINLRNSSTFSLCGAFLDKIEATDNSYVEITEGAVAELICAGSSTTEITGGDIADISAVSSSLLIINGFDFNYGYGYITDTTGFLTGTLLSGDIIDTSFVRFGDAQILLVPEPVTLMLFGLGGLVLRRRGK